MAKHLLAPPQGRCIAVQSQDALRPVLSPPLFLRKPSIHRNLRFIKPEKAIEGLVK